MANLRRAIPPRARLSPHYTTQRCLTRVRINGEDYVVGEGSILDVEW